MRWDNDKFEIRNLKNNVSGKMFVDVLDTLKLLDKKKKIENKVEEKIKSKLIDKLSKELKKEGVKSKIKIY